MRITHLQCVGLPHSDILGSKPICGYPKLFAAFTSFFASGSLGIRRTPLDTSRIRTTSLLLLTSSALVFGLLYCSREKIYSTS